MTTPLEALAYLSRQDPTADYFAQFYAEVEREHNDRAAAILLAANLEVSLRYAIQRHLVVTNESDKELFYSGSPLRSFEAKIRVGYSMGLYRDQTKNNLDCIKAIRNAFAHAVIPIKFETPEVRAVCDMMTMPPILHPHAISRETGQPAGLLSGLDTPRVKFQKICDATSHNLFWLPTSLDQLPDLQADNPAVLHSWRPLP